MLLLLPVLLLLGPAAAALNSCGCKATAAAGRMDLNRIVGGKEVSPKYKYPFQVYFQVSDDNCVDVC